MRSKFGVAAAAMVLLGWSALFTGPPTAIGTQGQAVIAGADNTETATTGIRWPGSAATCLSTPAALTLCGDVGLLSSGLYGGVLGHADADGTGVQGEGGAFGVHGSASPGGTGVFGEATGTTGIGVQGQSPGSGSAVYGLNIATGVGVFGDAANGTGVLASSAHGTALSVTGKAKFSRSGIVTIGAGKSSKTVTLAGVTTSSMVLATAQQSTTRLVQAAVPGTGSFVIKLNGTAPTGGVKVAYFVLN